MEKNKFLVASIVVAAMGGLGVVGAGQASAATNGHPVFFCGPFTTDFTTIALTGTNQKGKEAEKVSTEKFPIRDGERQCTGTSGFRWKGPITVEWSGSPSFRNAITNCVVPEKIDGTAFPCEEKPQGIPIEGPAPGETPPGETPGGTNGQQVEVCQIDTDFTNVAVTGKNQDGKKVTAEFNSPSAGCIRTTGFFWKGPITVRWGSDPKFRNTGTDCVVPEQHEFEFFHCDEEPKGVPKDGSSADPSNDHHLIYMALGDSYSSGHGSDSSYADNDCKRTGNAYPTQFFKKYKAVQAPKGITMANLACTGATTVELLKNQLPQVPADTDIVTFSIGGNDAHFADAATTCTLQSSADCAIELNELTLKMDRVREPITNVLRQANAKAPHAQVLVVGYPLIFDTGDCGFLGIREENRDQIRSMQVVMNTMLKDIVTESGNDKNSFVDTDQFFDTHRVCDKDRWINAPTDSSLLDLAGSYHPNADGQGAMADAVLEVASGGDSTFG